MKKSSWLLLIILLFTLAACQLNIQLPKMEVGETKTIQAFGPVTDGTDVVDVGLRINTGKLQISTSDREQMEATLKLNVEDWTPKITVNPTTFNIKQENIIQYSGIPTDKIINEWNLRLVEHAIYDLDIEAGVYTGIYELSGLPIRRLEIREGASDTKIYFNTPNPIELERFSLKTATSTVDMIGLGNANFSSFIFEGVGGDFYFDFAGTLQQDANVSLKSGVCNLKIAIPAGMNVIIKNKGAVSNITTQGTWTANGDTYTTTGAGYTLTITIDIPIANITLIHAE